MLPSWKEPKKCSLILLEKDDQSAIANFLALVYFINGFGVFQHVVKDDNPDAYVIEGGVLYGRV